MPDIKKIVDKGIEPLSLIGLVAEKEARDAIAARDKVKLDERRQAMASKSLEESFKKVKKSEVELLVEKYNIQLADNLEMPISSLINTFAITPSAFVKFKGH